MRLIDGWFPWILGTAAILLAVIAVDTQRRRLSVRQAALIVGAAAVVTTGVVVTIHRVHGLIADPTDDYPRYIDLLAWTAFVLAGSAIVAWKRNRWRMRAVLAAAPLLMLLFALDQSAVHYAYPPDLRTLLGFEVAGAHRFRAGEFTAPAPPAQSTLGGETPAGTAPPASPGKPLESTWKPTAMASAGQLLGRVPIPGTISGFAARSAYVYLPPAYFSTPRPSLPVLVLLPGVPGQPKNYLAGLSAQDVYARLAVAHHGLAPIVVFADYTGGMTDDLGCLDSAHGNVETYLTQDLPAFVEGTFGSSRGPAAWAIGGFSDGGTCALMIGLRHPDVYGPIVAMSADDHPSYDSSGPGYIDQFLQGDAAAFAGHSPLALLSDHTPRPHTTIYFESGDQEPAKQRQAVEMATAARQAGLPALLVTKPGKHNFDFWRTCVADSAPWVAAALGVISR